MRILPTALKNHFDALTFTHSEDPTELLIEVASSCVGITSKDPLVDLFRSSVALPTGQAWCLDFQQACIAYVEEVTGVKSPLPPTQGALDLWRNARADHEDLLYQRGSLILWEFGTTWEGHCGLVLGSDSLTWTTVEGNTSEVTGEISRTGNGVYLKKRAKGGSKTFRELGFLRVFE